ncbi:MAG: hypothetical protein KDC00_11935, partial [Flavobacteriales bacterium]|nr:hypothetical protein [Flavobacteriales bacterium]
LRNVLAVLSGIVIGSAVNMGLITISGSFVPAPEGMDTTDMESIRAHAHLFTPIHFLFPFLAHALGTLAGALVAAFIATTRKMTFALALGAWFLLGGIMAATMIPAPTWFIVLDIVAAYIPMAWLGGKLVTRGNR